MYQYQSKLTNGMIVFGVIALQLQITQIFSSPTGGSEDELMHKDQQELPLRNTTKTGLGLSGDEVLDRDKRAECPASPVGEESCIPSPDEAMNLKYEYTDENGVTCTCGLCPAPQYGHCACTPTGEEIIQCKFPVAGVTYMPYHNKCRVPFNCTQCPGNMVVSKECIINDVNQDSKCGCAEGYYQISDTTCEPIHRCPKNHQVEYTHKLDEQYTSYTCVPCPDGYIQPNDNSSDKCYQEPLAVSTPEEPTPAANITTKETIKDSNTSDASGTINQNNKTDDDLCDKEEPTKLPKSSPQKDRLLPRSILIAIFLLALLVTFVFGLYFVVLKNKCIGCIQTCKQRRQQQKQPMSSAVQFQQDSNGGVVHV
ncbi:uncharacterized protein [Amphiura filiformis]|uniref:uncharacterized protein n=1 Tax=Amphiura filiformis TaxID=82378 RepID=UPI003B22708F